MGNLLRLRTLTMGSRPRLIARRHRVRSEGLHPVVIIALEFPRALVDTTPWGVVLKFKLGLMHIGALRLVPHPDPKVGGAVFGPVIERVMDAVISMC